MGPDYLAECQRQDEIRALGLRGAAEVQSLITKYVAGEVNYPAFLASLSEFIVVAMRLYACRVEARSKPSGGRS